MKPIRIPPHTIQNLRDREIPMSEVERAISEPEKILAGYENREIYMRRYLDAVLDQVMLLRVILEETESHRVVVTVYKTSDVKRYLGD